MIAQIIHDHRMLYDPYIETAKDYNQLRSKLKGRGFSHLPMGVTPLLNMDAYSKAPIANNSSCKIRNTMIRKNKNP